MNRFLFLHELKPVDASVPRLKHDVTEEREADTEKIL
jgi:hypothetical protein